MRIFAFEVIPELSNKQNCGTRRVIELPPPRILNWELTQRPWGKTLDKIFTERGQRYYKGIDLGGSLYDDDAADTPGDLPVPEPRRTAKHSDTEESYYGPSDIDPQYDGPTDMEGSDPEVGIGSGSPMRSRRIRFSLPRRPIGDSDPKGRSSIPVRRRWGWDSKLAEVMDAVRTLRKDVMDAVDAIPLLIVGMLVVDSTHAFGMRMLAHDALERPKVPGDTETAVLEQVLPQDLTTDRSTQLLHDPVHIQELSADHTS
ncbi:hypothetical protein Q3G72_019843 [Acer saccharum]|nr:hypothetical protein Q3G72_019843 [Acer saccharum]